MKHTIRIGRYAHIATTSDGRWLFGWVRIIRATAQICDYVDKLFA